MPSIHQLSPVLKRVAAPGPLVLNHIHLNGIVPYQRAAALQDFLVKKHLAAKQHANKTFAPPPPYILTAEFAPVYTCGRREVGNVSKEQQDFLRWGGRADFVEAKRGGQTTFHGPGQLVVYPIIDLARHALSPKCYVNLLEETTIATLGHYRIQGMRTENTGVWTSPNHKIASIGVHMRRNITSHGVAINYYTDLSFFDRIVACGLEGKKTTSVEKFGLVSEEGIGGGMELPATIWVFEFRRRLRLHKEGVVGVKSVRWEEEGEGGIDVEALEEAWREMEDGTGSR